jgi:DNA polymerase-3 subunit gamma/tau
MNMAYEVTATRRRPQKLSDLIGQEFVAATLKNSIESGKIAHAYLFSGPRGCGKTSTARILAKALNCQQGPTATPCGTCSTCQEITKGSSLDVIEIDGASNTSVNDVRQIKDEVMFPPNSCRYKIYIIDEVHMLSTSAFNALLKTIEEPPPYVIFIFATTELQKVPATIKSRCQQFNFRLVPIDKVKEQLSLACQEIGITAEDEALYWVARESTGSMRDAYTLFDQVAAFSDGHITYEKIRDKLGLVGTERLNEIFNDCVDANVSSVIEKLDNFLQSGISIEQLITNSSDYLRSLLLIKNGITKESLLGQAAERYSSKVLENWNPIQIERALSIFLTLYRDIRYSLSPRYEIELAFSKLCWLKEYISPVELKKAIDNAQGLLLQGTTEQKENEQAKTFSMPQEFKIPQNFDQPQTNTNSQNLGQQSPFSNGGALPPKTIAAATEQFKETPQTERNFTQENYHKSEEISQNPQIPNSMESIKAKVIASTSISDAFISASLMQTTDWILEGNKIITSIESSFQKSQLETRTTDIENYISKIMGQQISFKINLLEHKEVKQKREISKQDQILANTFKGTILGEEE